MIKSLKDRLCHLDTIAARAGRTIDPSTGAVSAPIHLSTTFERLPDGSFPEEGYIYGRLGNPNRAALEAAIAALEGGSAGLAFGSGMAAAAAVVGSLRPGDRVVLHQDGYQGTVAMLREIAVPWGLEVQVVNLADLAVAEAALLSEKTAAGPVRLLWVETPSNPRLDLLDIAPLARLAHQAGALCLCDNTWATPILQRPLALGADLVLHSSTKYLGGHSDLTGGLVVRRAGEPEPAPASLTLEDFWTRLGKMQQLAGAVPSPFDCWLTLRSLQTLAVRMRAHCAGARQVAAFLAEAAAQPDGAIAEVFYPGLPNHPGAELARSQMSDFGGMMSLLVRGDAAAACELAARLHLFTHATSLGGTESLIEHRASIEGPASPTPPNLLRLSIGLEHPADLIADLAQAIAFCTGLPNV